MPYYYVYRITDKKNQKFYIGSRISTIKPEDDLGKFYFSSSTRLQFIKAQKENPERFIYEIVKTFSSEDKAKRYEKQVLDKINATNNPNCYNGRIKIELPPITSRITKDAVKYLGSLIKLARKEHGISQTELAERLNVSRATVVRIEAGNSSVSIGYVFEACFILRIPLFGCSKENISNLSTMLSFMHKLLPERIPNKIILDDDF